MPDKAPENVIIVGAGHAGVQAADVLRREGFAGRIVLLSAETHLPYQRPPLSKKVLSGELPPERAILKPASFYDQARIERRPGVRAEAIDCARQTLTCSTGESSPQEVLQYDRLILCLGSQPRRLNVPGAGLDGIHYIRTLDDIFAIRAHCHPGANLVVVGGGYIGLEVAATCRKLGLEVTVLEAGDRVMNRVVAAPVSSFFQAEHAKQGVHIHCNTGVTAFSGDSVVREVIASDGRRFAADVVAVGVGIEPVTALAKAAGIACDNGILVDEYCRTNIPEIFAAGDCTNHPSARYGRRVRLESVDNAFEQGRAAGSTIAGKPLAHNKLPWFWSDQFDLKLMIVGLSAGHDRIEVRGDPATRSFSVAYLRGDELIALDAINNSKDYMEARKLMTDRVP